MAGKATRFTEKGYKTPKPFLPLGNKYMIEAVMDNVGSDSDTFILICREEHKPYIQEITAMSRRKIIVIYDDRQDGQACAVLKAKHLINNTEPLLIVNSDQFVVYDKIDWWETMAMTDIAIMTFECPELDPKWSYARVEDGRVVQVVEKKAISTHATVGIYYFKQGLYFVEGTEEMFAKDIKVNGEYYVSPAIDLLVDKLHAEIFPVQEMYGLGVPDDYEKNKDKVVSAIQTNI